MPEQDPLRIGILCKGSTVPRWQAQAIRQLIGSMRVEVVVMGIPTPTSEPRGLRALLENRITRLTSRTALLPEGLSDFLTATPIITLSSVYWGQEELDQFSGYGPDVIFSFLPEREFTRTPPQGILPIWQFMIKGSGLSALGAPRSEIPPTALQEATVAFRSTDGREVRVHCTRTPEQYQHFLDPMLFTASWLPLQAVKLIAGEGKKDFTRILDGEIHATENEPSISSVIKSWIKHELHRNQRIVQGRSQAVEWNIGILHQPIQALLDPERSTNVRWLPAPSEGNQRVEPFGYTAKDGQLNVLYRKKQAHGTFDGIARLRPRSESVLKRSRTMLTTSASLHYPFVIERPDGVYAVISYPHQDRTELFRVAETNDGMDHIKTMMDKALSSPTLTFFEGQWWLFGTDPAAPDSVLLAYHANSFDGPYKPHACNPLKLGSEGTRPAGTFFMHEGTLWRPSQDLSEPDISAVVLNKVIRLTTAFFEEEPGRRITGFAGTTYAKGVRTLSAMGDITLIDGLRGASPSARTVLDKKPQDRKRRKSKNR